MKAVIAQSDVVTAYGWGIEPLWNGLMSGQTAIKSASHFSRTNPFAQVPDLQVEPGTSRARTLLNRLLHPLINQLDPSTPLILATTVCEIEFIERAVLEKNPDLVSNASPQMLLAHIKQLLGLHGPAMVASSACASSSAALTLAASMIERGIASDVLVITCDVISEFVYSGFSTLLSLCETPARPFDANRCGLSLGEAAAWALVTRADSKLADKKSPAILGWSSTADGIHMTAPDRAAGGLSRAIAQASAMADIQPRQIDFIAAHGTATIYNDAMELLAFRNSVPTPVPTFSIKGGTGHTLAAAGLVQILVSIRALKLRTVPATVGLSVPDENAMGWTHLSPAHLKDKPILLSTNSGFGGVNTALLLGSNSNEQLLKGESASTSVSIRAVSWFSTTTCGSLGPDGLSHTRSSPPISSTREMIELIGLNIKYFSRMTSEARSSLAAASLAMKAAGSNAGGHIGILGTGYDGWLTANQDYFRDYVAQGKSLGRANLFIYTLPTSALSEIAIALTLTGPTLHLHSDLHPQQALIQQAMAMVKNREADGMLCVWSDPVSTICVAIGNGEPVQRLNDLRWDLSAEEMSNTLAKLVG